MQIGDKVKIHSKSIGNPDVMNKYDNYIGWVVRFEDGNVVVGRSPDSEKGNFFLESDLLIIKKTDKFMTKVTKLLRRILSKEDRDMVKAGYLTDKLELTDKGKEALFSLLYVAYKGDLAVLATEDIKEEEEE